MAEGTNERPIIIRRRKVVAEAGHHGGAWKVAYADFVTAMMAFFLLMWLLNATTEKQRKGLADYFNPTIAVNRVSAGGEAMLGGDSLLSERSLASNGTGGSASRQQPYAAARDESVRAAAAESAALRQLADMIEGRSGEAELESALMRHVRTRLTDEGLVIELSDLPEVALFEPGTAVTPTPVLRALAAMLGDILGRLENPVAVAAHVAALPVVLRDNPVWPRSVARAGAMRRLLQEAGLAPRRIARQTGWADRRPGFTPAMSPRNNRLEIIVLRQQPGA